MRSAARSRASGSVVRELRTMAVPTAPGWTLVTPTRVSRSSTQSASESERTADLVAQ